MEKRYIHINDDTITVSPYKVDQVVKVCFKHNGVPDNFIGVVYQDWVKHDVTSFCYEDDTYITSANGTGDNTVYKVNSNYLELYSNQSLKADIPTMIGIEDFNNTDNNKWYRVNIDNKYFYYHNNHLIMDRVYDKMTYEDAEAYASAFNESVKDILPGWVFRIPSREDIKSIYTAAEQASRQASRKDMYWMSDWSNDWGGTASSHTRKRCCYKGNFLYSRHILEKNGVILYGTKISENEEVSLD